MYSERMIKNDTISICPHGNVIYVIVGPIKNNIIKFINQDAHV